jgi:carboxylesterase type B
MVYPSPLLLGLVLISIHPILIRTQYQTHNLWPEVRLPQGLVRGRSFRSPAGRDYMAFLGIPYATPPLGPLRFKVSFDLITHRERERR